jgi:coproporphyrinogen III oxidase
MTKESIADRFRLLQDHICGELEKIDGIARFNEDAWSREAGGGGRTRTLANGSVIEKGGVAFSEVFGEVTPVMKKQLGLDGETFFATGVSIVLHPENPHVPIIHMNVRYFELNTGVYWFGGGIDLTPHYIIPEQAGEFHRSLASVCEKYNSDFYPRFKVWADDYFFNTHRNETRGVGGIFYDHLDDSCGLSKDQLLAFAVDLGELFPVVYKYQVDKGKNKEFTADQVRWRNVRRGRYVEFNLVHDRGTKFGLLSGGRTESILLSMPPQAEWFYNETPNNDSAEFTTLHFLKKGLNWLNC